MLIACAIWCAFVAFGAVGRSRPTAILVSLVSAAWTIFAVQDLTSDNGSSDTTVDLQIGAYLAVLAIVVALLCVVVTKPTRSSAGTPEAGFAPPAT